MIIRVGGKTGLGYIVEGAGIPLLVVGSSLYYPRTFSRKLRQSCSLICLDLPHFAKPGSKFNRDSITFDSYAKHIEAVRATEGLERVVVVGHSHHGNVALEYAKRYPQRVSHIVMIGSPPVNVSQTIEAAERYWKSHAQENRKRILQERRSSVDTRHLASLSSSAAYVLQYVTDAPLYWNDPEYDASWLWKGMTFSMEAIHAFRDLYQDYQLDWGRQVLDIPVLIVMGEHDYAVPHTLWRNILPNLGNVTFHLMKQSGHTPQLEQPDEFDRLLLRWVARHTAM